MALYFIPRSRERTEIRGGRVGLDVVIEVDGRSRVFRGGYVFDVTDQEAEAIREAGLERGLVEADRRPSRHPDEAW